MHTNEGATANVGAEAVREALGQRSLCDISIETYTPKGREMLCTVHQCGDSLTTLHSPSHSLLPSYPADEMTYAEATSTTPSLGTAAGKKEDTPPLPRDRIAFFSGIPAVECIKGVLHLYRHRWEPAESSLNLHVVFNAPLPPSTNTHIYSPSVDQAVSELVCILCVPAHMQLSDMLDFLSPAK